MEFPGSYETPAWGDLWPHCHSIRSARGSTVLRGSGPATSSLTGRERCRRGYVLYALSRLLWERDRVGWGVCPLNLMPLSDRSPTPPFHSRVYYPFVTLALNMNS